MRELRNKVVVITGAGSGIGRALALQFAKSGSITALTDINGITLRETVEMVEDLGGISKGFVHDISIESEVKILAREVQDTFGGADVLINNAGLTVRRACFQDSAPENFDLMMDVNFYGPVYCTRAFLPQLSAKPEAHIANVTSIFSMMGVTERIAYCSSKFALRGFTETLRLDLGKTHIGVTSVIPGAISTNITQNSKGWKDAKAKESAVNESARLAITTPEYAAQRIIKAVLKNKPRIIIGRDAWWMDKLARFFPTGYLALVNFSIRQLERKRKRIQEEEIATRKIAV
ncbi:MAG: SDR family NAD(P)-dependent oxidoreductase [Bacteroidia bacterium]|nr:SDR family NAD(P)-dependent oxidoreductase [Bacteroidia bacterium]